jgi:CubicO group peptidase (beta-lactamase class C family)
VLEEASNDMDGPGLTTPLVPLPRQPEEVPWPTQEWPVGEVPAAVARDVAGLVDDLFDDTDRYGATYALAIVHRGRLVVQRVGGSLPKWDRPDEPVTIDTPLLSWSMAKSVTHAAVGILVGEGRLDLDAPAAVPAWHEQPDDPRGAITLQQLLEMRDGLRWLEDYVDGEGSDVIHMLFGEGKDDVVAYTRARPLAHEPGTTFNYSSGTSNVVARIVGDAVGDVHGSGSGAHLEAFLRERLFDPIGMRSASPRFDAAGTFVGSSYLYATLHDWARFGLLYLRGGEWDGTRVLPEGWVDHARRWRSTDPDDGRRYGAHWWIGPEQHDHLGTFWASGYESQSITCVPGLDLLAVRLGRSTDEQGDEVDAWRAALTDAFLPTGTP